MKRVFTIAAIAAALCALAGCYIGKAEFKGEEMKMYPFFGPPAFPISLYGLYTDFKYNGDKSP